MRSLSRSTAVMFLFDLFALTSISYLSFNYCMDDSYHRWLKYTAIGLIIATGLFSFFLKGHYKIREFNITPKNTYLLFEGCVFAHIPTFILLMVFAHSMTSLKITCINLIFVFVALLTINGQTKLKFLDTKLKYFNFAIS